MSLFDKIKKGVGDVVDRGKQEVDQFMRIQKINGEISELEKKIAELKNQIQASTRQAGEKALALVRSGEIASPDLKAIVDDVTGFEQQIAAEEAGIAEKKKAIEAIKAEDEVKEAAPAAEPPPVPPVPEAQAPAAPAAAKFCSACGAALAGSGGFCPQCGAKQA